MDNRALSSNELSQLVFNFNSFTIQELEKFLGNRRALFRQLKKLEEQKVLNTIKMNTLAVKNKKKTIDLDDLEYLRSVSTLFEIVTTSFPFMFANIKVSDNKKIGMDFFINKKSSNSCVYFSALFYVSDGVVESAKDKITFMSFKSIADIVETIKNNNRVSFNNIIFYSKLEGKFYRVHQQNIVELTNLQDVLIFLESLNVLKTTTTEDEYLNFNKLYLKKELNKKAISKKLN